MRRFITSIMLVAALAGGSHGAPVSLSIEGGLRGSLANILPADTAGYLRLSNVRAVRRDLVQAEHVTDATLIRSELEKILAEAALRDAERSGPFGASAGTSLAVFDAARSIHVAMVPAKAGYDFDGPGGKEPEVKVRPTGIIIVEVDSMDAVDAHLKKVGDKIETREVHGVKVHTLKAYEFVVYPEAVCKLDDHTLVIAETVTGLERILETKTAGKGSLGENAPFREAYAEFGEKGDLFGYVSFDSIREIDADVPKLFSSLAGYADVGGEATVRIKTAAGEEFPEFLAGGAKPKRFLGRIPAEAAFMAGGTCNGGASARAALFIWILGELESPQGFGKILPRNARDDFSRMFERAKNSAEYAGTADLVAALAAVPIKSEWATFVGPDRNDRWSQALILDYEERSQAEAFVEGLKDVAKKRAPPLNWESKEFGGTTIHFVDLAKMLPPGAAPGDLRIGYAISNELLAIGTVGAIEFVLEPSDATYADRVRWKGVDRDNTMLVSLAAGSLVRRKLGEPKVDKLLARVAKEIPRNANYTVTLNVEKQEATLRTNVPIGSLFGWLSVEFATDNGPAKLKDFTEVRTVPGDFELRLPQEAPAAEPAKK